MHLQPDCSSVWRMPPALTEASLSERTLSTASSPRSTQSGSGSDTDAATKPQPRSTMQALRVAVAAGEREGERFTGSELVEELTQEQLAEAAEELHEPLPTCPICLGDIADVREKAVLLHCFHVFCVDCLNRWLPVKRLCPLCKARVDGYLYDIRSEADYKEHRLPEPPSRRVASYDDRTPGVDFGQSQILSRWRRYGWAPYRDESLDSAPWVRERRSASASERAERAAAAAERAAVVAQRAADSVRRSSAREPRPYYRRVRQHLEAGAASRCHEPIAEVRTVPADAVLTWRRSVYERGLWAVPLAAEAVAGTSGVVTAAGRERRLEEWVGRELRALFQSDDVNIVRVLVMSLIASYGFSDASKATAPQAVQPPSRPAAVNGTLSMLSNRRTRPDEAGVAVAGGGDAVDGRQHRTGPVDALRPFLMEHADRFWHELRCFASAPYSAATYDRLVQYTRAQHLTVPPAAGSGDADGAAARAAEPQASAPRQRPTRWDVRDVRRRPDADASPEYVDLTAQTPPREPPAVVDADPAAASVDGEASAPGSQQNVDSRDVPRQRSRDLDSANEPKRRGRLDADRHRRRSGKRRSSKSPDSGRGRRSIRKSGSRSHSRLREPKRSRPGTENSRGRRVKAEQHRAQSAVDSDCDQPGLMSTHDCHVNTHRRDGQAHDLAAAELRSLRERALQGMLCGQPASSSARALTDNDRWAMD